MRPNGLPKCTNASRACAASGCVVSTPGSTGRRMSTTPARMETKAAGKEMRMELTLIPWSDDDLRVLERANSIDMTKFLGGVESDEDLAARHALYVGFAQAGGGRMFRVEVDGESAGYAGWWDEV